MKPALKHLDIISFRDDDGKVWTAMVHSCEFPGWSPTGPVVYAVSDNGKEWLVPVSCVIKVEAAKLNHD